MKNTNICPKCGGNKVLPVKDVMGERGIQLVLGWLSSVPVTRYVCTGCGYVESWVDDKHLPELKARLEYENR